MILATNIGAWVFRLDAIRGTPARSQGPQQQPPTLIENRYAATLVEVAKRTRTALEPLLKALPRLVAEMTAELKSDAPPGQTVGFYIDLAEEEMTLSKPSVVKTAENVAGELSNYHKNQLTKQVNSVLGVDVKFLDKNIRAMINTFVSENVALITNIPKKIIGDIHHTILGGVTSGKLYSQIADELDEKFAFGKDRAKLIAIDQTGKFYGNLNKVRQQELGVTRYIWRTPQDERVRKQHRKHNGFTYGWDKPPYDGHPGQPIRCRCFADPVLKDLLNAKPSKPAKSSAAKPTAEKRTTKKPSKKHTKKTLVDPASATPVKTKATAATTKKTVVKKKTPPIKVTAPPKPIAPTKISVVKPPPPVKVVAPPKPKSVTTPATKPVKAPPKPAPVKAPKTSKAKAPTPPVVAAPAVIPSQVLPQTGVPTKLRAPIKKLAEGLARRDGLFDPATGAKRGGDYTGHSREALRELLASYRVRTRLDGLSDSGKIAVEKMPSLGVHNLKTGEIRMQLDQYDQAAHFFEDLANGIPGGSARGGEGAATLVHESIHGAGPLTAYDNSSIIIEEVTTESITRKIMNDLGDRHLTAPNGNQPYDRYIHGVSNALRKERGLAETAMGSPEALETFAEIQEVAFKFKNLEHDPSFEVPGNTVRKFARMLGLVDKQVDGFAATLKKMY